MNQSEIKMRIIDRDSQRNIVVAEGARAGRMARRSPLADRDVGIDNAAIRGAALQESTR
jgi:hypothetical protein